MHQDSGSTAGWIPGCSNCCMACLPRHLSRHLAPRWPALGPSLQLPLQLMARLPLSVPWSCGQVKSDPSEDVDKVARYLSQLGTNWDEMLSLADMETLS